MAVSGIEKTLRTLLRSSNPAATELLIGALAAENAAVRQGAVRALALREDVAGHRALIERFAGLPADAQSALSDVPPRAPLSASLSKLLTAPRDVALAAADAADLWGDVDTLPAIASAAFRRECEYADRLAPIVLRLAKRLDDELAAATETTSQGQHHRDPIFLRRAAINALIPAIGHFEEHRRPEYIEALLMFAAPDESAIEACLVDPDRPAFAELASQLQTSEHPNALAILSRAIVDQRSTTEARAIAASRADAPGMEALFARLGDPIGSVAREACARIDAFAWLDPDRVDVLVNLSAEAQAAAIQVAACSADSRRRVAAAVRVLLRFGTPQGRRAACRAIANLPSHVAIEPLREAFASDDPAVLAVAAKIAPLKQYPHATAELVRLAKHESEPVQRAAQSGLEGVSLSHFREHAESLSEEDRRRVGTLVGKADPVAPATLRSELASGAVARRLRALELVELTGLAEALFEDLIERTTDPDAGVRTEAIRLLATTPLTEATREALEIALNDANGTVRTQAEQALSELPTEATP